MLAKYDTTTQALALADCADAAIFAAARTDSSGALQPPGRLQA